MFVGLHGTAWLLSLFLFFSSFGLMALIWLSLFFFMVNPILPYG